MMKIFDSEELGGARCEFKFLSVLGVGRMLGNSEEDWLDG